VGWVPTEWYPTALAVAGNTLYVATAKGRARGQTICRSRESPGVEATSRSSTYIATLLHGSLAAIDLTKIESQREQLTRTVIETNMMKAAQAKMLSTAGRTRSGM
jgi:hypothetical protein